MIITSGRSLSMGGWVSDLASIVTTPVTFVADVGKDVALPVINAAGSIAGGAVRAVGAPIVGAAGVLKGTVSTLHPDVQAPPAPSNLPLILGLGGAALLVLVVALSGRRGGEREAA